MLNRLIMLLVFILANALCEAQEISLLTSGKPVSLRGLSVINDKIVWVSGSAGSVGLSTNGGNTWKWIQVLHYEKSDFRDIEAFSDREAVVMGITEPAVILRTIDGGNSWTTVFEDSSKSVFLDAMDFNLERGTVVGDPINGKIFLAQTEDGGKSWKKTNPPGFPTAAEGEAFFASSGSNLALKKSKDTEMLMLVSGGMKSNLYMNNHKYALQLNQGKETTGANSIAVNPGHPDQAIIVGGDFRQDTLENGNSLMINLNPFSQKVPSTPPHGYRSCIEYITDQKTICCGTSGVDFSKDGGLTWTLISKQAFHVCRRAKSGTTVFLAGPKGSVARLETIGQ
jgi:hypothetical protein